MEYNVMDNNYFKNWLIWNIGGSAAAIAVLGIMLLLIGNDIFGRAADIEMQRKSLTDRMQILNSLISLRSGSERAKDLLPKLQNSLPSKDQLLGFSKILDRMAKANQLNFNFSFLDEIVSMNNTPSINNFSMTLSGSYADFLRFLKATEASQYYMVFNTFEITSKGKEFEMIIRGKVFSQ